MNRLPSILFQMDPLELNVFRYPISSRNWDIASAANGSLILRDLIAFRQVWIKVVFARKVVFTRDCTMASQAQFNGLCNGCFVDDREGAWMG